MAGETQLKLSDSIYFKNRKVEGGLRMKQYLAILAVPVLLLVGCSIPIHSGSKTISGKPMVEKDVENFLQAGAKRAEVIQRFGEPSWTAFDEQIICYEGQLDHGTRISGPETLSFIAILPLLIYGGGPGDIPYTESLDENRRVLILFNQDDQLVLIQLYSSEDQLEHTKLSHLIEFYERCGLPKEFLTEENLNIENGSEPSWKSADGRIVFYGSILSDYGEVNGVFIRFNERGIADKHKRGHFRSFAIRNQFNENLDKLMLSDLGDMSEGIIVTKSYDESLKVFPKAIKQVNPRLQIDLEHLYKNSKSEQHQFKEKLDRYTISAKRGDAKAQVILGNVYAKGDRKKQAIRLDSGIDKLRKKDTQTDLSLLGKGVPQDLEKAIMWYTRAAEQGESDAQKSLGLLYADEKSVRDRIKSHMWLSIAALNGNMKAENEVYLMEIMMTPEQIAEAKKLAEEWLEKHKTK